MKYRVGYEKIKGFSSPVIKAEEVKDWLPWLLVALCSLAGLVYLYMKVIK